MEKKPLSESRNPVEVLKFCLSDIDLLLMPLVGWDEAGNRLGMGAGYYDRALAAFQ